MKNKFKRTLCLLSATALVFSMTACAPKTEGEENDASLNETVSDVSEKESEVLSEISEESSETSEASSEESGETSLPDEGAEVSNSAHWGLRDMGGVYQIEIEIESKGTPTVAGSTIKFTVKDTIHDYKVYDVIKCQGELMADKNLYPDMVDQVYGGDGIFGFPGDWFSWKIEEGEADQEGKMVFAFLCHRAVGNEWIEDAVTWEKDGSISVNNGVLTEIGDLSE